MKNNLCNQKFSRLLVIAIDHKDKRNSYYYKCLCDCGNYKIVAGRHLRSNKIKSCGCLRKEVSSKKGKVKSYKHGKSKTRLYKVFRDMKTRCYNKNSPDYIHYGAKGIKICDEWLNDYLSFEKWAIQNGYNENAPKGKCTIDRIDFNGNYEPQNCRWISIDEQNRNKTFKKSKWDSSILLKIKEVHSLRRKDVAEALNIKESDVKYILRMFETSLKELYV